MKRHASLILGGQRSGKSAFAEGLLAASPLGKVYLATAQVGDDEMARRIARHRARRPSDWRTLEEPLDLPAALVAEARPDRAVLVDCLTMWLTNLMLAARDVEAAGTALCRAVAGAQGTVVLVSNEVGQGVIPTNAMARAFVDHAGTLHQRLALVSTVRSWWWRACPST